MATRTRLFAMGIVGVLAISAIAWGVSNGNKTTSAANKAAPAAQTTPSNSNNTASTNNAADNSSVEATYSNFVSQVTNGQIKVEKQFAGPGDLVGLVVVSPQGQKAVVYVDKGAQYIIVGNVITADGQSRTSSDTDKYVNSEIAQAAWANADKTAWVLDGSPDAKHMIYAIGDPNCSACHKFYTDTRPYVENGDLAIRWIWVGFLRPSSPGMAMAIMSAKDPAALLKQNESQFNSSTEQGGIKPIDNPPADLKAKFDSNMKFMSDHQFTVTPTIIYQDNQGQAHTIMGALPEPQLKQMVNGENPTN